jgi:hypothetical protein
VVTDHEALGFFKNQQHLMSRQTRWMEFMERFDYTIEYIEGEENKVADCLSCYYQSDKDGDVVAPQDFVNADMHLDPEGDDLPNGRMAEFCVIREAVEPRVVEAQELANVKGSDDRRDE